MRDPELIRTATVWKAHESPRSDAALSPREAGEIVWIDLVGRPEATGELLAVLEPSCPGLTAEILEDLLTPDEKPDGKTYSGGSVRLASTFSVEARRLTAKVERGKAQGAGVLVFQPVELLAGEGWLLTCWHPTRTFCGAEQVAEGSPVGASAIFEGVGAQWRAGEGGSAGDLGVMVMHELALTYNSANWALKAWLEDWELSLYVDDDLDNPDELPQLWGSMAVLRDWLSPLNRPGLRTHPERAWLPVTDHDLVIEVDKRIDRTLDNLRDLSNVMRSSFSVLHVQMAEEERARKERTQHRVELIAAIFLVPTLVVGLYGANTWVPGQGEHWGFWVMAAVGIVLSAIAVGVITRWRIEEGAAAAALVAERKEVRENLLLELKEDSERRLAT